MFLKLFIVSVILVAFTMLALGVKLLFDKDASFTHHSCALDDDKLNDVGGCIGCQVREIADCADKKDN